MIAELPSDDDAIERFRQLNRRRAYPMLVVCTPGAGTRAAAMRLAAEEGVVLWRLLPAVPGELEALDRFVGELLERSPAAAMRYLVKGTLARKEEAAAAFANVVVDRLQAGKGLPRKEGRTGALHALAGAAGLSLRHLEEKLHEAALPRPRQLAAHVAVLYTALLGCTRARSLVWAAEQAGLTAERVRTWRRRLGLKPGLPSDQVFAVGGRVLARMCALPAGEWTVVLRGVAPGL